MTLSGGIRVIPGDLSSQAFRVCVHVPDDTGGHLTCWTNYMSEGCLFFRLAVRRVRRPEDAETDS